MPRLLTALRPVADGGTVILEGQPYMPTDDKEERTLLATKRWQLQTKEDAEAWATRLSRDPVLAERMAGEPAETVETKGKGKGKGKPDADEQARLEAEAKAKAEAEEKARLEAEEQAKAAGQSGPASTGTGIG
ncbi:hypothetical protein [Hyphomonas sp.]|uniref:hypothetical protein n=1 Tax=Hyphomonas sp. TaxID=87 RepID=UPI0025C68F9A|nr:hypothetical protein [Hyphomonas sp.]MBI1401450.1 hypothetical protein [Hyphomonas sp.]